MSVLYFVFWISLIVIFYSYIGYGILITAIVFAKKFIINLLYKANSDNKKNAFLPEVTLVVAAYNEEDFIGQKIRNCFELDYPADRLSFVFITDGSTDRTPDIIRSYPSLRLLHQPERRGKTEALNRAMRHVTSPLVIFCDANTLLNKEAVSRIVAHYQDARTGGVAGEKRILAHKGAGTAATGEGLYWKYESWLKKMDAGLYTVVGAAGELFSIRTALWTPVERQVILDDFVISLRINLKGYRIAYEPMAYAMEWPSASLKEEQKRKIRISAGAFQAVALLKDVFNIFRYPLLFFQFFSHRLLRWTITPLCLPLLLISGTILSFTDGYIFVKLVLAGQLLFYALALTGARLIPKKKHFKPAQICYYVFFMNYSLYLGFIRYLKGAQPATWAKAQRAQHAIG